MSTLQTLVEIAEGAAEVFGVVTRRAERIEQIKAGRDVPPDDVPRSRYGRGRRGNAASTAPSVENAGPTIEPVIDAETGQKTWIVRHGTQRIECDSEAKAKGVRDALL